MSRYAADTSVSAESSRAEIERTLQRYGATSFMYGWQEGNAVVGFVMENRQIRFILEMPDKDDREFTHTPTRGTARSDAQAYAAWEQATRQRWRALNLVIKAKLEAVESGISTFDEEFYAHIVLPSGQTVYEETHAHVEAAYAGELVPPMLGLESGE
jgi:hypothetical protein